MTRGKKTLNNRLILGFKAVDPDRQSKISKVDALGSDKVREFLLTDLVLLSGFGFLLLQMENLENSLEFLRGGYKGILVG